MARQLSTFWASVNYLSTNWFWIAVVGAVSWWLTKRLQRKPPVSNNTSSNAQPIATEETTLRGATVLIDVGCLLQGKALVDREAAAVVSLSSTSTVFLMYDGVDQDVVKSLSLFSDCIPRHHLLLCNTTKGYEAFARQLKPTILITTRKELSIFLSRFLRQIVLVGEHSTIEDRPNIKLNTSLSEFVGSMIH